MAVLRKMTDEYDGEEEVAILYKRVKEEAPLSLWQKFKRWLKNVFK